MGRKARWTKESATVEALKYDTKSDFIKGSGGAYNFLSNRKFLREACQHMKRPNEKWTKKSAQVEAAKYKTMPDFREKSPGAYNYLRYHRLLAEVAPHLELKNIFWDEKLLQEEALKYNNRGAFQEGSKNAYSAARTQGLLDKVCTHMVELKKPQDYWTYDKLAKEALKYETRGAFYNNSESAYQTALNSRILDKICVHMVPGITGFDKTKKGILYYLKINSGEAYKIGITNRTVQDRFSVTDLKSIEIVKEWYYDLGFDAYFAEQNILQSFKDAKYTGDSLLESGNSELFYYDVLGLDIEVV